MSWQWLTPSGLVDERAARQWNAGGVQLGEARGDAPTVISRTGYQGPGSDATSWTIFSGVDLSAGTLAIVLVSSDGAPTLSTSSSGWVKYGQQSETSSNTSTLAVFYKVNPTASETLDISSTAAEQFTAIAILCSGANNLAATAATGSTSSVCDPPSLDTGAVRDYLFIVGRSSNTGSTVATAAPSGYTNLTTQSSVTTGNPGANTQTAERLASTQIEDPAAFTGGSNPWVGYTIAVWSGAVSATLAADGATFALAGQSAGLLRGLRLGAASGSLTLTGQSAGLLRGSRLAGDSAAVALSGTAASLKRSLLLTAAGAAYTLTGQSAGLLRGRTIGAASASFTLAGQSVGLLRGLRLVASGATFTVAGQGAGLQRGLMLGASGSTFAVAGQPVTLGYDPHNDYAITADGGSFTLMGQAASLVRGRTIQAFGASFALTGSAVAFRQSLKLFSTGGIYSLAGPDVALRHGGNVTLVAAATNYTVTGALVTLRYGRAILCTPSASTVSGGAVIFRVGRKISPETSSFACDSLTIGLCAGRKILSGGSGLTLTGQAATLKALFLPAPARVARLRAIQRSIQPIAPLRAVAPKQVDRTLHIWR